jgi:prevent-host-death family protein
VKLMTASEASLTFSAVLDEAERGETVVITRGGRRIAMVSPASAATWGALRRSLAGWRPPADKHFDEDMRAARNAVTLDEDAWPSA